jgi:hypothetical protein
LTITRPDLPEIVYILEQEYTHLGRGANNEIPLPYPSISNRHCVFVQSGPDMVLRDLNSSNGTYVNNELISEVVLRPGDLIQTGTVAIKFEPGVKRPKLNAPATPAPQSPIGKLKTQGTAKALVFQTTKLEVPPKRPTAVPVNVGKPKDDSVYVKGESAISYTDLAQPVAEKKNNLWLSIVIVLVVLAIAGAGYYFLFLHPGRP